MIDYKFEKYPAYKDSGVKWLGEVPAHWKIEKGKWLFQKEDRPVRPEDEIVTCFRDGQVTLRSNRRTDGFTNAIQEHGYQGIRRGDLVIHAMDAFAGAIGVSDSNGKSTPVYSVCTPRVEGAVNSYFYAYLLRNLALTGFIQSLAKGIRERSTDFRFNDFANLLLSLPPLPEQTAITNFLDEKTAKIDTAIAQKEKLIGLLEERKQIIIQQAVTKGLDPAVKFKDSGVEWIGEIPAHWEILYNRRLFREKSRKITNPNELPLSLSQVDGLIPSDSMKENSLSPAHRNNFKLCYPKDLIVNRFKGHLGVFFESKYRGIVTFHYGVFEPTWDINTKYYELLFHTEIYKTVYAAASNGMTVGLQNLSNQNFYDVKSVVPPKEEQDRIVEYCSNVELNTKSAIEKIIGQIEKLKEYKAILINSAVTGKIKVG